MSDELDILDADGEIEDLTAELKSLQEDFSRLLKMYWEQCKVSFSLQQQLIDFVKIINMPNINSHDSGDEK